MNDTELDELLNISTTPAPSESLRERMRAGIEADRRRPPRRRLLPSLRLLGAVAAVLVVAFLVVNPDAFPEKVHLPYTVDSEIIHYPQPPLEPPANSSSSERRELVSKVPARLLFTSYNRAGSEVILSWSAPDHPLQSLFLHTGLAFSSALDEFKRRFLLARDDEADAFALVYPSIPGQVWVVGRRDTLLSSGCKTSHGGSKVLGQEVVLNYPTTVLQQDVGGGDGGRSMITLWMAPELGCFALRATIHMKQADGTWSLASEKKALKVTVASH